MTFGGSTRTLPPPSLHLSMKVSIPSCSHLATTTPPGQCKLPAQKFNMRAGKPSMKDGTSETHDMGQFGVPTMRSFHKPSGHSSRPFATRDQYIQAATNVNKQIARKVRMTERQKHRDNVTKTQVNARGPATTTAKTMALYCPWRSTLPPMSLKIFRATVVTAAVSQSARTRRENFSPQMIALATVTAAADAATSTQSLAAFSFIQFGPSPGARLSLYKSVCMASKHIAANCEKVRRPAVALQKAHSSMPKRVGAVLHNETQVRESARAESLFLSALDERVG